MIDPGEISFSDDGKTAYHFSTVLGRFSRFCCGVDFRPDGFDCLFSILHLKSHELPRLAECIAEILALPLADLHGHYNWWHRDYVDIRGQKRKRIHEIQEIFLKKAMETSEHSTDQRQ